MDESNPYPTVVHTLWYSYRTVDNKNKNKEMY